MRKQTFLAVAVGLTALLVAGGVLTASNMGFKNNYPLDGPGVNGSASGTSSLAMPYNQQTNIQVAEDLINDINATAGSSVVSAVARWDSTADAPDAYTGSAGTNFNIDAKLGYFATVGSTVNYIIVGSHDPSATIDLDGPGTNGSASGTTLWSFPYHSTAANAEDLINEVNGHAGSSVVSAVARWDKTSDAPDAYTGSAGTNFNTVPGEAYFFTVGSDVTGWAPDHY
ncbi:MAG: hypothetical protein GY716_24415 [bacterium]|nr:hypothetical protein [bacterium]